ncbi:NAD(P)-dependent oxidoreductase [Streptomyces sp. NPDC052109]|uniref:SDR family oxidoreductase n=1 Tax=Streptomyces sp. NPDC052109 TaxID=3155527 RepID=UPI003441DDFB
MRILLLGAEGLLGTGFRAVAAADPRVTELTALGRRDVDVTDHKAVSRALRDVAPDACVNAAVLMPADLCDREPEQAYAVNALGARWVSRACAESGAVPVYVSTDFVFDGMGERCYLPEDLPSPLQTYGTSKLAGEQETRLGSPQRHLVLRTAALFGPPPDGAGRRACFVDRIAEAARRTGEVRIVDNVVMSPTYTVDFAAAVLDLLHHGAGSGRYHLVNQGSASWYRLGRTALERLGIQARVVPVGQPVLTSAPRPHHTPLGGELPPFVRRIRRPWQAALDEYLGGRSGR